VEYNDIGINWFHIISG